MVMQDMKGFWDKKYNNSTCIGDINIIETREDLGLFFWERGGKQFVKYWNNSFDNNCWKDEMEYFISVAHNSKNGQDFLDCLACLGEDKVKEVIENMKEKN